MTSVATAKVNGLNIAYEVVGDGERTWSLTAGGRFNKETPGLRELAVALAEHDGRVLIWDRPNCGASDVSFDADTESNLHADTLAALLEHLDLAPAIVAGGSAGSRVSLLTAARHPGTVRSLALWWISGGVMGLLSLGNVYCAPSLRTAWKEGSMEAVADLSDWAEVIEKNPANRQRILDQDRDTFMATMERWMMAYCPQPDQHVPGLPDDVASKIDVPAIVFRSGASDPSHPRATTEAVAELLPNARLVEPPWGDREWHERQAERDKTGGLFVRWPLLAPQLLEWADEVVD
jgi:pimeloyl-ACP methyl ester carboxylesterase